ncbi:hypothetical protein KP509_02G000400 [Ceratopteris richardii]|uniref:Uncharacterized protein n=1 Tax=Ceratopteris richardii TaxID=49495 RepID=A0A8T2VAT7_CERRI|nr:hypothetical protein KP509_02G000400 [Ceratopteris richardii]
MAEVLGTWEKQVRALESENKELKRVNTSLRKDLVRLESENMVLDLKSSLMVDDCFGVAIEEESERDEENLIKRLEQIEQEMERVQSLIGKYSDQVGRVSEDVHLELERIQSAQVESNEKVRRVEKENARLSSKLGRWMNRKDDETGGQVEDPKVGKMEGELKAMLDRLDAFRTELERT